MLSAYDRRGARIPLTYPAANGSGATLTLTADDLGRLTQIAEGGTSVATLTHVGAGRLVKIASQDGSVWQGLDWDAAGRRTRGKVTQGEGANAPLHFEEEIAFDDDDRVLSVKWPHLKDGNSLPQVQQYTYDEQARLLKVEQGYGTWNGTETKWTFTQYSSFHDFRLDEQGNWAQHQDGAGASFVSPTIAKDNAYTAWPVSGGSLSFVLDDTGRFLYERPVAGGGKYLYKHDGLGRLVSAEKRNAGDQILSTTTYGYTADGRLAWRKEGAAAREWLIYDGSQAVVQTTETQLAWTHVWTGSRLVRSLKHGTPDTVYHPHQDRLGSIVVVTRQGQAAEKKLYDAYGRLVAVPDQSVDTTPLSIPFGYAGARWEATAGLYQMGARWYDPELGRFLEQDPIGEAGGLNLYAYVGSSPTLWVDPTGLAREGAGGSVIGRGPVNRTSQRQIIVDGMSTSDMLTGSSGGWLDWGSSHQDDYYGPSKDKPGYNPTTRKEQRAAARAAAEAKAAADAGEVPDATEATSAVSTSGAAAPLGLAPGRPVPPRFKVAASPAPDTCPVSPLADLQTEEAQRMENGETVNLAGLTPQMREAVDTLSAGVDAAGGTITITSGYRPPEYQAHLQEVWDKHRELDGNTTPACIGVKSTVDAEFTKHALIDTQRPVDNSKHIRGLAIDATVKLPKDTRVSVDELADVAGLVRPKPINDSVHFALK